jgi:hypothetical protein
MDPYADPDPSIFTSCHQKTKFKPSFSAYSFSEDNFTFFFKDMKKKEVPKQENQGFY